MQLVFPTKDTQTTLGPDVVMWSAAAKKVLIIELCPGSRGYQQHISWSGQSTVTFHWSAGVEGGPWTFTMWRSEAGALWRGRQSSSSVVQNRPDLAWERQSRSWWRRQKNHVSGCGYRRGTTVEAQNPNEVSCIEWRGETSPQSRCSPTVSCLGLGAKHLW